MQAQWPKDGELMGFGIFEGIWLTITGEVVRSTDVDLGSAGGISFRLKSKDGLLYVVMVFKLTWATHHYPMDLGDLRNLEDVLRATRQQLEPSRMKVLARENAAEMTRLGILQRVGRWVLDTPLWKKDLVLAGAKFSFRIRRKQDERCEILSRSGEHELRLRVGTRGLELMEDAVIATRIALENSRKSH